MDENNSKKPVEILETRLVEASTELGKMTQDDKNRPDKLKEVTALTGAVNILTQSELSRISQSKKDSIEEAKLAIEEAKVENEKKKIKLGWWQFFGGIIAGVLIRTWSYTMGEHFQEDRAMGQFADKVSDTYNKNVKW